MDELDVANVIKKLCPTLDLSENALVESGKILKDVLRNVIRNARVLARHAKRISIDTNDINQALLLMGHEAVYGSHRFVNQRLESVEGRDVYFATDPLISTAEVHNVVLKRPPADLSIHSHWLAIEGNQPHVPENEIPQKTKSRKMRERSTDKTSSSRNRKNHSGTVQSIIGGMVHGGVELRLPVEHALTTEQLAYFEQIQHSIEPISNPEQTMETENESLEATEKRIENLRHDAALQPLVPYLLQFVEQQVYTNINDLKKIQMTLHLVRSLVRNPHLDLGLYSHHILPLVLSCLLSENLGDGRIETNNEVCRVRSFAAAVLASSVRAFDDVVNNVQCRIAQKLTDCLDLETSCIVKHGAILGLEALGVTRVEDVQKILCLCSEHIEESLKNTQPTSLAYLQGKTCIAVIDEILERTRFEDSEKDSSTLRSPLHKRARQEDAFI